MRRLLAALSMLAVLACSGGGSDAPPPPPTTGAVRLANSASLPIYEVYVAPSADPSWGAPLNADSVPSGGSFTVIDVAPGSWDVMAVSSDAYSDYWAYWWSQPVTAGLTTPVTAYDASFTGSLRVYNGDVYLADITALYVVPSDFTGGWGDDQLAGWRIAAGETFTLWEIPPDYYDVWCEFGDDAVSEVEYDVPVSSLATTFLTCDAVTGNGKLAVPVAEAPAGAGRRAAKATAAKIRPGEAATGTPVLEDGRAVGARWTRAAE